MSAPTDVLAVIGNAVNELECHEKGIQPRTYDGLRGHGWATAEELSSTRAAIAELIEAAKCGDPVGMSDGPDALYFQPLLAERLLAALANVGSAS